MLRSLARIQILGAILVIAQVPACDGAHVTTDTAVFPVTFTVSNNLLAPVTISINGSPYVTLSGGKSTPLTVSSTDEWLTWISAKPLDPRGRPIPDDIGDVTVALGGINRELEITNVINDQTYITARIFNLTTAPVSIGVYDGTDVSCASELPAGSADGTVRGFTQIGYYKLLAGTELRAYRDPADCSGPYVAWPSSQIKAFATKSGLLTLSLETAP